MEKVKSRYSTCTGPSMYPTLRLGDGLELSTYSNNAETRVGDVIVYPHPDKPMDVVHRIIKIKPEGVITRGDNNNKIDPYVVKYDDIAGKVIAAKRKNRLIHIKAGKVGFCIHKIMLFRKYFVLYVLAPLRFVSKILAESKILNIFDFLFKPKVIYVKRNNQIKKILVVGNKAIGKQLVESGEWQIRFPYKYFISKNNLNMSRKDR